MGLGSLPSLAHLHTVGIEIPSNFATSQARRNCSSGEKVFLSADVVIVSLIV
nr:MAG TPA: hypothetical protein [Caudoviricetes sp.]